MLVFRGILVTKKTNRGFFKSAGSTDRLFSKLELDTIKLKELVFLFLFAAANRFVDFMVVYGRSLGMLQKLEPKQILYILVCKNEGLLIFSRVCQQKETHAILQGECGKLRHRAGHVTP